MSYQKSKFIFEEIQGRPFISYYYLQIAGIGMDETHSSRRDGSVSGCTSSYHPIATGQVELPPRPDKVPVLDFEILRKDHSK